jgi:hypothetical protein
MSSVVEELSVPVSRLSWNESILSRLVAILQTALPGLSRDTASLILRRTVWERAAEEWEARMDADTMRLSVPPPPAQHLDTEVVFERVPTVAEIQGMLESRQSPGDAAVKFAVSWLALPKYNTYFDKLEQVNQSVPRQFNEIHKHSLVIPPLLSQDQKADNSFDLALDNSIRDRVNEYKAAVLGVAEVKLQEAKEDPVAVYFQHKASRQVNENPRLSHQSGSAVGRIAWNDDQVEGMRTRWLEELKQKVNEAAWKLFSKRLLPVWEKALQVCEEYNAHRDREKELARTAVEHSAVEEEPEEWSTISPVVFGTSQFRMNTYILDNVMQLVEKTHR